MAGGRIAHFRGAAQDPVLHLLILLFAFKLDEIDFLKCSSASIQRDGLVVTDLGSLSAMPVTRLQPKDIDAMSVDDKK